MQLSIGDLRDMIGGRLRLGAMPPRDGECSAVGRSVTDSRRVKAGDVFWGLRGASHDGSQFAEEALLMGATGLVTSGRWVAPWAGGWSLEVEDSLASLWKVAQWQANRFKGQIVTVEESRVPATAALIEAVLALRHVGECIEVARHTNAEAAAETLINLPSHADYLVAQWNEGQASSSGTFQAENCRRLATPDVAVFMSTRLTPPAHCGRSAALTAMAAAGVHTIVDGDCCSLPPLVTRSKHVIAVGRSADCDVLATHIECSAGRLQFRVDGQRFCVATGRHQLTAALAAVAVGRRFGMADREVAEGLASYEPQENHRFVFHCGGLTIIDQTSHDVAAPSKIAQLADAEASGRRVLVIGEKNGVWNHEMARLLGETAVTRAGVDRLIACGPHASAVVEAAREAGLPPKQALVCEDVDETATAVASLVQSGDVVLLAGALEKVKQSIVERRVTALRRAA